MDTHEFQQLPLHASGTYGSPSSQVQVIKVCHLMALMTQVSTGLPERQLQR